MRKELMITAIKTGGPTDTVYFGRESAELTKQAEEKLVAYVKTAPGDISLEAYVSDDEYTDKPENRAELANSRAKAVAECLRECGWSRDFRTIVVKTDAPEIEYASMRKVVITRAEAGPQSGKGELVPKAPPDFEAARLKAVTMVQTAIKGLESRSGIAVSAARTFLGADEPAELTANLRSMLEILEFIRPAQGSGAKTPPGTYRYLVAGGPDVAATTGWGEAAAMEFGPEMARYRLDQQADTFIHEAAHAADTIRATDYAYDHDRLFRYLAVDQVGRNADSYRLLVDAIAQDKMPTVPEIDTYPSNLPRGHRLMIGAAIAYTEVYLRCAEQEIHHAFQDAWETVYRGLRWPRTYDRAVADVRAAFQGDLSSALTKEDLHVFAGIHFRLRAAHDQITNELTVRLGEYTGFDSRRSELTISKTFFSGPPMRQIGWLLVDLLSECSAVANAQEAAKYADLAKRIADSQGRRR